VADLLKGYLQIGDRDEPRTIREKVTGKLLTLDRALEPELPALLALLHVPVEDLLQIASVVGIDVPVAVLAAAAGGPAGQCMPQRFKHLTLDHIAFGLIRVICLSTTSSWLSRCQVISV
jgi:hypothetical protein